jgi:site-specific recombinase XerD
MLHDVINYGKIGYDNDYYRNLQRGETMTAIMYKPQADNIEYILETTNQQHIVAAYLASLAPTGQRSIRGALSRVAAVFGHSIATMPWSSLRAQHLAAVRHRCIANGYSCATINHALAAVRGVLKTAWLHDLITTSDYHKAIAVRGARGSSLPAGRDVANSEIQTLMRSCDVTTPAGIRDRALLAVLWSGGLRRDEVAGATLANYDAARGDLVVTGKGNKQRVVCIGSSVRPLVNAWLAIRGNMAGALFNPINRGGRVAVGQHMTAQAVYKMLHTRAAVAGVATFSPHDLRRTFVGNMLANGTDIATVATMCGHSSINTTARYDRRKLDTLRAAADRLTMPM